MIHEITELLEAKAEKEKCFSECEYDAGYFCFREVERLDEAERAFEEALNHLIDKRIEANKKPLDHDD